MGAEGATGVSVGVVGAGDIARKMHLPVLCSMPGLRVEWIFDQLESRSRALGAAYGVTAVASRSPHDLPRVDVVLLAVPVEARRSYLEALVQSDTALFCEKPFATNAQEHCRLVDLYPIHSLGCAYMRRFYESTLTLRHIVAQGWFGRLIRVRIGEGGRSRGAGSDTSFLDAIASVATTSGVLTDLGSHSIDLALLITGAQRFDVRDCDLVLDGKVDRRAEARVELIVGNSGGEQRVELEYCVSWLDPQPNRIELEFERAKVFCGTAAASDVFVGEPQRPAQAFRLVAPTRGATTANQAFYMEWRAFLTGLANREESSVSARSALLTTALVETLHECGRRFDA